MKTWRGRQRARRKDESSCGPVEAEEEEGQGEQTSWLSWILHAMYRRTELEMVFNIVELGVPTRLFGRAQCLLAWQTAPTLALAVLSSLWSLLKAMTHPG